MKINEMAWAVIDCETTGIDPEKDRIVEVGFVWGEPDGIIGECSLLFNPGIPIPASASAIHHIIDEDVVDRKPFDSTKLFSGDEIDVDFYAAHNAEFDGAFLKPIPHPLLCTMRLAQKLWPDMESFSNQFLRYQLKLNPPIDRHSATHRALPDAICTATLLIREIEEIVSSVAIEVREAIPNNTLEEVLAWIAQPMLLTTIRFGKHKGTKFRDLPKDYLRWIVNKMDDASIDLIHTAKFWLN